jgi:hypothetical protein
MQAIFLEDEESVNSFVIAVSKPRLTKYLQECHGDTRKSLLLYHWNSKLSQSLYLPLQSWEVVLRNKLNEFFIFKYGKAWPKNPSAIRNFSGSDRRRLTQTIERLEANLSPAFLTTDKIVSDLSAGFWVSQFGARYEIPYTWRSNLKNRIFANDQTITRDVAEDICDRLLDLRNRVAHHEPIFHLPLDQWRADLDRVLNGMCKNTGGYMASACSFKEVWNDKPGTQILLGETPPLIIKD